MSETGEAPSLPLFTVFKKCLRCGRAGPGQSFKPGPSDGSAVIVKTCTACAKDFEGDKQKFMRRDPTADSDTPYGREK